MPEIVRQSLWPGIGLTSMQTDKFKTSVLSVSLLRPLSHEEASLSALTPRVLCRGTGRYPDMAALSVRLEELYGARLEPSVRKKGEIQCVGFVADFIDGRYLPGKPDQLAAVVELLGEVLLRPAGGGACFEHGYVEAERTNLADEIAASKNDKVAFASRRLRELMCAEEAFGVNRLGDEREARAITPEALWRHYQEILATSRVEAWYIGPRPAEHVAAAFREALSALPRSQPFTETKTEVIRSTAGLIRQFEETMDVGQGKLALGMRMGTALGDPNYPAAMLATAIYGGTPASKLFLHVRERLQLCYYASALMEGAKGLMIVSSGIDADNRAAAEEGIFKQWEDVRNGDFSAEELSAARLSLCDVLHAASDNPHSLEDYYLGQTAAGLKTDPDTMAGLLEEITASQVADAARASTWDSVYFLHGGEIDEDI